MEDLKPCPFCGRTKFRYDGIPQIHAAYDLFADCSRLMCYCGAQGPASKTTAIATWNRRAPDPVAEQMYEALKAFLVDPQFQVAIGGNPNAVDAMYKQACDALAAYEKGKP